MNRPSKPVNKAWPSECFACSWWSRGMDCSKFMDVHGWWKARWMIVGRSPLVPATSYDLASGWWFSRCCLSMRLHEPWLHDRFTDLRLWKKQPHGRRQVAFWKSLGSAGLVGERSESSSAGRCDFAGSSAQVRVIVIVYDLQWWNISKKGSKGISPQYFLGVLGRFLGLWSISISSRWAIPPYWSDLTFGGNPF